MSPALSASEYFDVRPIPNAGRGVIAKRDIPACTVVLESGAPVFHVIFKDYAKETCANCFVWDRGRTLPIRDHETARVFCSSACQLAWLREQGELGLKSWQCLAAYIKAKRNGTNGNADLLMSDAAPKPDLEEIDMAWREAEKRAKLLNKHRFATTSPTKADRRLASSITQKMNEALDPNTLSYMLCGVLFKHTQSSRWYQEVLELAMDELPYKTRQDLGTSCNSFVQLASILPSDLLTTLTPELCRTMLQADNHNAFGIRAGGEDSEEYMGYGVYPSASYFNHSCSPNIIKRRIGKSWVFSTARDIAAGEECCITYLGGDEKDMNRQDRQSRLQTNWGFGCCCMRCKVEADMSM